MSRIYGQPELVWHIPEGSPIRQALEPLVHKWLFVLPDWMDVVEIALAPGDATYSADMATWVPYRMALERLTPDWLAAPPRERELTVIHEFLHCRLAPLATWGHDLRKAALEEGGALDRWARQQYQNAEEAVITEMATMLLRSAS